MHQQLLTPCNVQVQLAQLQQQSLAQQVAAMRMQAKANPGSVGAPGELQQWSVRSYIAGLIPSVSSSATHKHAQRICSRAALTCTVCSESSLQGVA